MRKVHSIIALLALVFAFLGGWLVGDLNEHMATILLLAAVVLVPGLAFHQWISSLMLEKVWACFQRENGDKAPTARAAAQALVAIERYPFREAILSVGLWLVAGSLVWVVVQVRSGMTAWQVGVLFMLLVCAALVDALLGYHGNQFAFRRVRAQIETWLREPAQPGGRSGQMVWKLSWSFGVLLVVVLAVISTFWMSRVRQLEAGRIISDKQAGIRQVAASLGTTSARNADASMRRALARADPSGSMQHNAVVIDEAGKVVFRSTAVDFNPEWFERIVETDAGSWLDTRAPFLYLVRKIPGGRRLIWVAPMAVISETLGSLYLVGILAALVLAVLAAGISWSLANSNLRPLRSLYEHVRRLARGEIAAVPIVYPEGEASSLADAVNQVAAGAKQERALAAGQANVLVKEHARLEMQVRGFRDATDRRTDIAEQTATSVVEMRSSIQSISEQMESLREASTDCTSAMFEIDQSVREVASSAENLQNLVDDTASAMTEITSSMQEVSKNVDNLAKTADETVSSIAVIDQSIKQVEENTTSTHRLSKEVSELASRGATSVRETITGINEIQQITDEAREVINRLGNQMEAVGKILTVIGDVAEQTNLLALNAAIIAAAAGEHGKGFAVVADEIKDLADRTSTSTKEIAGLIRSVQAESRRAIEAMQRGSGSVRRGVELANTAGQALQQILSSVQQVTKMSNDIATSTTEHSEITRAITKSMGNISSMVREIKRAVTEQSTGGNRIGRVSEQMRDDARFVFRSANEQVQAASGVTRNMERISEMVSFVSKAMAEQSNGVNHVARVAEEVRDAVEQEQVQMADLDEITDRIGKQAREFASRFENGAREGEKQT